MKKRKLKAYTGKKANLFTLFIGGGGMALFFLWLAFMALKYGVTAF